MPREGKVTRSAVMSGMILLLSVSLVHASWRQEGWSPIQLSLVNPAQVFAASKRIIGLRLNAVYGVNDTVFGVDVGLAGRARSIVGIQANAFNQSGELRLFSSSPSPVAGVQLGVVNLSLGLHGVQLGAANIGDVVGVQLGVTNMGGAVGLRVGVLHLGATRGWELGVINIDDEIVGVRTGVLNLVRRTGNVRGLDLGFFNHAGRVTGVQVGVFNYCEEIRGFQLGLFNMIRRSRVFLLPIFNTSFQ